jgi:cytochrome c-type biogenesis protein CcmH
MIFFLILFSILAALFLLPSLVGGQKKQLQSVEDSLADRLDQLKHEFQFRTKELDRRLNNGDLAQSEWQELSNELQLDTQNAVESTQLAVRDNKSQISKVISLVILIIAIALGVGNYILTGTHKDARLQAEVIALLKSDPKGIDKLAHQAGEKLTEEQLSKLYLAMREKIELYPNDVDSWRELARFNMHYGRSDEAHRAMELALKLDPSNVDLQVDFAQLLTSSKDMNDVGEAFRKLSMIVSKNPQHNSAKILLGYSAFKLGQYQLAINVWEEVLNRFPDDQRSVELLTRNIDAAKQRLASSMNMANHPPIGEQTKGAPVNELQQTAAPQSSPQNNTANIGKQLIVEVKIPDEIRAKLSGNESLFVYATAANGMKFPLAVVKTSVNDLPHRVILSDSQAMQPQFKLSNFEKVKVIARISKSGNAISQPGDIQGQSSPIDAPFPDEVVTVVVDQTI